MRFFLTALFALSLTSLGFGDDIKVSKADAARFMQTVDYLQGAIYTAGQNLDKPEGVREYRDLMRTLRLHQETVGGLRAGYDSGFAKFMWEANPWTNRNIGLADEVGGESLFKKAWAVLDTYSDIAISKDAKHRAVLSNASNSIMDAAGLELTPAKAEPAPVTISEPELEAAVAFAALGLAHFPGIIAAVTDEYSRGYQLVEAVRVLRQFLGQEKALAVLRKRAQFSLHANVALRLVENGDFSKAIDKVDSTLEALGEGHEQYFRLRPGQANKFKGYAALLMGNATLAREEAEKAIPPSQIQDIHAPAKGTGRVAPKSGPLEEDEAKVVSAIVHQMFDGLDDLAGRANYKNPNASYRGLRNSAYALRMLLEYFANNERNHLSRHFYNVNPWAMRNWISLAKAKRGEASTLKKLSDAIANHEGLEDLLRGIGGTNAQESIASEEPPKNFVDLKAVGEHERLVTETYALGTVAVGLQALAANLVNRAREGNLTGSYARHVTQMIHKGIELLAARQAHLKFVLARYVESKSEPFEIVEVRSAAALVENLGKVLGALTFLENGFETIDAADGSAPFTIEEGTRMLYELVTANKLPATASAAGGGETGFCLGQLDGFRKPRPE